MGTRSLRWSTYGQGQHPEAVFTDHAMRNAQLLACNPSRKRATRVVHHPPFHFCRLPALLLSMILPTLEAY